MIIPPCDLSQLTTNDLHQVAKFNRIIKNYIKMKKLLNETKKTTKL
jgi:hypothetical protein